MKNKILKLIAIATLVGPMVVNAAPTLIVDAVGQLRGAQGVEVGGVLYNVTFTEGTCAQVFGTCETSSFTFQTQSEALLASQALLDQVFLDDAQGAFDSDAALTFGCDDTALCVPLTAYAVPGPVNEVGIANAQNRSPGEADPDRTDGYSDREFKWNTGTNGYEVYAKWSQGSLAQDCSKPMVSFGEVMAGLQAGFTGGAVSDGTLPSGLYLGVSGIDQRGFIDPESGSGWKCDSDWGLVSAWLGIRFGENLSRQAAREAAGAFVPVVRIAVDGDEPEVIETNVKLGVLPIQNGGADAAMKSWGVFLEPNTLAPGFHTAEIFFGVDQDCRPFGTGECDGVVDYEIPIGPISFEVFAN
jgi:hypothetical protein